MENKNYTVVVPLDVLPSAFGCSAFFKTPSKIFSVDMDFSKFDNIKLALDEFVCERPTTFEFLKHTLDALHCELVRADFYNEDSGTFFIRLSLAQPMPDGVNKIIEIDCRPSDAIPLALRCSTPIYIENSVLDRLEDVREVYYSLKETL